VPATLRAAKVLLKEVSLSDLAELAPGYQYVEIGSWYGDVPQRWLLIHSEAAAQRAHHTVAKQAQRASERELRAFLRLTRQDFACADDALEAGRAFAQTLQWSTLDDLAVERHARYEQPGRPAHDAQPMMVHYRLTATLASSLAVRDALWQQKSCFILATNQLDEHALSPAQILTMYKSQDRVERGFRFLKDPQFLASALFLKSPARLMALLMVMTLCLLVYAALEFRIRQALQTTAPFFPDQKGKPTLRPTARWVFHMFVGIHLLTLESKQQLVLNLRPLHQQLLELLGAPYLAIYSS
jgi:transposase